VKEASYASEAATMSMGGDSTHGVDGKGGERNELVGLETPVTGWKPMIGEAGPVIGEGGPLPNEAGQGRWQWEGDYS
jgi:hypothetical protein